MVRLSSCNTGKIASLALLLQEYRDPRITEDSPAAETTSQAEYRFVSTRESAEILRLYATGMSAKAVAEEIGRPPRTVSDTLRKHGVEIRKHVPTGDELVSEMVRLYEEGLSCAKIADALGISRSRVGKHLQRAGIALRSKSEAAVLRSQHELGRDRS